MHFGNVWLLAGVCFVLGGCSVAAMPSSGTSPKLSAPTVTLPEASANNDGSRLGPPSPSGLGRRRVDRVVGANAPLARY